MVAVDTNIVIRLLVGDDAKQTAAAKAQFASRDIWIAKTVLLEASWVLRSLYGYEDKAVQYAFRMLLGLKNVHAEDEAGVAAALGLMSHGIEFDDAINLCSRPPEASFVSFDRTFIRRATKAGMTNADILA
jgi:predicted nucleic-acid-binding protein